MSDCSQAVTLVWDTAGRMRAHQGESWYWTRSLTLVRHGGAKRGACGIRDADAPQLLSCAVLTWPTQGGNATPRLAAKNAPGCILWWAGSVCLVQTIAERCRIFPADASCATTWHLRAEAPVLCGLSPNGLGHLGHLATADDGWIRPTLAAASIRRSAGEASSQFGWRFISQIRHHLSDVRITSVVRALLVGSIPLLLIRPPQPESRQQSWGHSFSGSWCGISAS